MGKLLIQVFAIIILVLLGLLYWLGFFDKVVVSEAETGPYVVAYEDHVGPYNEIKVVIDTVYYRLFNEEQIETTKGFGIYYDNPKLVDKEKLRSIGGSIIEEEYYDKISELERNFKLQQIEKTQALRAEFPFKNQFSVMVGVLKIYPLIQKYAESNNYEMNEVMEIYDMPNKKIIYLMPIQAR